MTAVPNDLGLHDEVLKQQSPRSQAETIKMTVKCLALDYDGTLSTTTASRRESKILKKPLNLLRRTAKQIPVVIVTTKDLAFVTERTPFAHAWSAISGLETRIGKQVQIKQGFEHKLKNVVSALNYAKSHLNDAGAEIEEKQDFKGRTIAFCVDWRRAKDTLKAMKNAEDVAAYCGTLQLEVIRHGEQPFFDVYPVRTDKGTALQEITRELRIEDGILYMGDSEADNMAFKASNISVGVTHKENAKQDLACYYLLEFEEVSAFLSTLLANDLLFASDFPMIKVNFAEMRR